MWTFWSTQNFCQGFSLGLWQLHSWILVRNFDCEPYTCLFCGTIWTNWLNYMWSNIKFNISLINSWVGFYLPVFSVTWCVSVCACNIITSALIPLTWSTVAPGFHISCTNAIEHQRQLRKTVDALCLSHIPSEVNSLWLLPWQIAAKGREHGVSWSWD